MSYGLTHKAYYNEQQRPKVMEKKSETLSTLKVIILSTITQQHKIHIDKTI